MENLFLREEQVVADAEKLLKGNRIETENDRLFYSSLVEEYRKLLKQTTMLVKISDLNQSEMNEVSKRFELTSNIDELTGLYNRRYFNAVYRKEWASAVRTGSSLAIVIIDIDYFKKYNDIYGHLQGDKCLKLVSEAIKESVMRPRDVATRFGGDEFVVLLPNTDVDGAIHVTQKIMREIEKLEIRREGVPEYEKVTVSIGIAVVIPKEQDRINELIDASDKALYQAKSEGRNCFRMNHLK